MASNRKRSGNERNIYRVHGNRWYVNWQACGEVYRKFFHFKSEAIAERDWLEAHRTEIEEELRKELQSAGK